MALKKCKECGKEVSTKADKCPHCGAKQKRKSIGCGGAILILIVLGFISYQFSEYTQKVDERKQRIKQAEVKKQKEEKFQSDKKVFDENIEKHYSELISFVDNKHFKDAFNKVNLFKKYKRMDYKDVENINKIANTQILKDKVKKLPASDIEGNLKLYKELLALNPSKQNFKNKVKYYQNKWNKYQKEKQERDYRASCKLEILSSSWSESYGYATYEGQVKNISNSKLENVQAVVTWYDKNGNMITSSSALIEYNPILPGQTSPFKVMKTYNPAMKKAGVEFSRLMGGKIRVYRKK